MYAIYLTLLFLTCSFPRNTDIFKDLSLLMTLKKNEYQWMGHPTHLQIEPFEYMYFIIPNTINKKDIKNMNYSDIINSCYMMSGFNDFLHEIDSLKISMRYSPNLGKNVIEYNIINPMHIPSFGIVFPVIFYNYKLESLFCKKNKEKLFPFESINRLYCYPTGEPGIHEYATCNCVFYFYYKGGEKRFMQSISDFTETSDLPHCKKE